jgi:hypothetical protein
MNFNTFTTIVANLPESISVLIRGPHGIGKSQGVAQVAKALQLELIDRRVSQMTEGDLLGLPSQDGETTRFLPPDWIKAACNGPKLLFLDELNRATTEVQQACFQLVLDREINGYRLHPDTRVMAAINTGGEYQVSEMDPALLDRFFVVDLQPTEDEWLSWAATSGKVDTSIIDFIRQSKTTRLDPSAKIGPGQVGPSRRSWERLSQSLSKIGIFTMDKVTDVVPELGMKGTDVVREVAAGFVGLDIAGTFVDFVQSIERLTIDKLLAEGWKKHGKQVETMAADKKLAFSESIADWSAGNDLTTSQAKTLGKLVWALNLENSLGFLRSMVERCNIPADSPLTDEEKKNLQVRCIQNLAVARRYVVTPVLALEGTLDQMPEPLSWHGLVLSDLEDAKVAIEMHEKNGGVPSILESDAGKPIPLSEGALRLAKECLEGKQPPGPFVPDAPKAKKAKKAKAADPGAEA